MHHKTDVPAHCLTPTSLIRAVSKGGQMGKGSDKSMQCEDPECLICRSFKPLKGEEGKKAHLSLKLLMCAFSLTGGYQGKHASQPPTTWTQSSDTAWVNMLESMLDIVQIYRHVCTQTCALTHSTKSKANNVSACYHPCPTCDPKWQQQKWN